MAATHGSKARVYANGVDLSPYLTSVTSSLSADTAEVSTLGSTSKAYIPGLRDAVISAEGIWDGAPGAIDATLSAALGAEGVFTHWPQGDALGSPGLACAIAAETSYEVSTPVDDAGSISVELQASGGMDRVASLLARTTVSAGGNGTALDNGAATNAGGVGYLHVFAVSAGTLTAKVQHSIDNSVWTDLITFTARTGPGSERIALGSTVTVQRYLRALWTITGGATFAVAFARR